MTQVQILLLIAVFLTITIGSFVWYVATWTGNQTAMVKINANLPDRMHGLCMDCASDVTFGKRG